MSPMRWAFVLASLLSACQRPAPTASSSAVTNSTPTDGDPGVVALLRGGALVCTATLIAPRVLLTAGHCLAASGAGIALRLVGFGRTGATDTSAPRKREGTSLIASLAANDFAFAPSPSQTCEGDSGGPAFATLDGAERVVGVTSSGDPQCA